VFELLGHGCTSKAIAARLGLSVKTIDSYRESMKQKLGLPDGVALIQHATLWVQRDRSPDA
jgi:DNA-binding NarL/FixJ family response regulator